MKKQIIILFLINLFTRIGYVFYVGFFNNYGLQSDSNWLVEFGLKNAANLNFNFELDRFVASPLFPSLVGLLKLLFRDNWNIFLILIQLFLSALSGIYIYKIGVLLFNNRIGYISSLIFSVFPMTLWYTNTFSQECIFQSFFIISIYYLIRSVKENSVNCVLLSSIFFSLSYLTKSHTLLFSLFIPLIYFHFYRFKKQTFLFTSIFAFIAIVFSLPYGIYCYKIHKQYIISSNGAGYQFYLGNTEAGYKTIVNVPDKNSVEFKKIQNINVTAGYFNGSQNHYDSLLKLPQNEKQNKFFSESFNWIQNNPLKFIELKVYNILFFLVPGVSWRHYTFLNWLFSFVLGAPIYFFAYYSMIRLFKSKNKNFVFIFYIFCSMFLFSTIWYVQNRFRTITIEPFYIVYAAYAMNELIEKKFSTLNSWICQKLVL